jgi:hypothetical protein
VIADPRGKATMPSWPRRWLVGAVVTATMGLAMPAAGQRQWTEADFRARRDAFVRQCNESHARSVVPCDQPRRQRWGDAAQCRQVWDDVRAGCLQRAEDAYRGAVENLRRRGQ